MAAKRTALVTGAARGQGLAIVRQLVKDGYAVLAGDVLKDELAAVAEEFSADSVVTQILDVTSADDWQRAVNTAVEQFGALDALVNNAGILHTATIAEEDPADFERAWRVNTLGPFLGLQACLPELLKGTNPAIVNTASTAAERPFAKHIGYSTSKWAMRGLSLSAAAELSALGIRVNTIFPGPIATPMHSAETIKRLSTSALLGRAGEASDIGSAVAFLLSESASFISGAELRVDGGQMLRMDT